jgi:hypothetical protein
LVAGLGVLDRESSNFWVLAVIRVTTAKRATRSAWALASLVGKSSLVFSAT